MTCGNANYPALVSGPAPAVPGPGGRPGNRPRPRRLDRHLGLTRSELVTAPLRGLPLLHAGGLRPTGGNRYLAIRRQARPARIRPVQRPVDVSQRLAAWFGGHRRGVGHTVAMSAPDRNGVPCVAPRSVARARGCAALNTPGRPHQFPCCPLPVRPPASATSWLRNRKRTESRDWRHSRTVCPDGPRRRSRRLTPPLPLLPFHITAPSQSGNQRARLGKPCVRTNQTRNKALPTR